MPLLDLSVYVAFETFMAFMNEPGLLEVTGIPTLGNAPLVGTTTYKELIIQDPLQTATMTIQLQHINVQSTQVASRQSPTVRFDGEPNIAAHGSCVSLGIKVFTGDNFGVIDNIYNEHDSMTHNPSNVDNNPPLARNHSINRIIYAPDAGGAIQLGIVQTKTTNSGYTHVLIKRIAEQQQQGSVVPAFEWVIFNHGMTSSIFTGGERYTYTLWWTVSPGSCSIPPVVPTCDICVIRVKGKQWPRDLKQTTITSSSVQTGLPLASYDPKNKHETRTAKQEKAAILTKMEASRHSLRTTRLARRLVRQTAVIGPPL